MPLPDLSKLNPGEKDALILAQAAQLQEVLARLAALERQLERLLSLPKTPDNSSLPPLRGQKPNRPDTPVRQGPRQGSLGRRRRTRADGRIALPRNAPGRLTRASSACSHCIMPPLTLPHPPEPYRRPPQPQTPTYARHRDASPSIAAAASAADRPDTRRAAPPAAARTTPATSATAPPGTTRASAPSPPQTGPDDAARA